MEGTQPETAGRTEPNELLAEGETAESDTLEVRRKASDYYHVSVGNPPHAGSEVLFQRDEIRTLAILAGFEVREADEPQGFPSGAWLELGAEGGPTVVSHDGEFYRVEVQAMDRDETVQEGGRE